MGGVRPPRVKRLELHLVAAARGISSTEKGSLEGAWLSKRNIVWCIVRACAAIFDVRRSNEKGKEGKGYVDG